jgi:hypothetical protein
MQASAITAITAIAAPPATAAIAVAPPMPMPSLRLLAMQQLANDLSEASVLIAPDCT